MDPEKHVALELALENRLRADLSALPVRPYAYYREAALRRIAAGSGAPFSFLRTGATVVVAVVVAVAAGFAVLNLRGPSPAASPTPTASLAPTPVGFTLPQGCSYVGDPIVTQPGQTVVTTWEFNCGAAPDFFAIERLSPAFTQQGWTLCSIGQGRGTWWKGTLQTTVGQSAVGNPVLTQLTRQSQDCPAAAQPTARPWSARTAAEVLANLPGDENFPSAMAALSSGADADPRAVGRTPSLGAPIYVRGLRSGDRNEYLVPVKVGDTTIALMMIGVDADGLGRLDAARGWSTTPSFPAASEAAAIARGSTAADPVIEAELVWTNIRGSADELQPFWSLTRASRAVFFLFEDGTLVSATAAGP